MKLFPEKGVFFLSSSLRGGKETMPFVLSFNRLRCAGHILNLVVKAALFEDAASFSERISGAEDEEFSDL